ncbi:MAG: hypothetical protein ACRDL7_03345, partial [Gaiellaceae bacterium]
MAYDEPESGITYILVMSQALYFGDKLLNTLLCPNQLRANGLVVDDVPRHLSGTTQSTHSIYCPNDRLRIPLQLYGCISYLPVCKPTAQEIENCHWIELTNDVDWNPYSPDFAIQERTVIEKSGDTIVTNYDRDVFVLNTCITSSILSSVSSSLNDDNMINVLEGKV